MAANLFTDDLIAYSQLHSRFDQSARDWSISDLLGGVKCQVGRSDKSGTVQIIRENPDA